MTSRWIHEPPATAPPPAPSRVATPSRAASSRCSCDSPVLSDPCSPFQSSGTPTALSNLWSGRTKDSESAADRSGSLGLVRARLGAFVSFRNPRGRLGWLRLVWIG
eukprot:Amastigsp_a407_17.p4 type:complete len:106 gc:universal Amastigsp_a407_17:363-46(-)